MFPARLSAVAVRRSARLATTQAAVPGLPRDTADLPKPPAYFLNINIPDLSQPDPDPPVQIPFAPDHWESSKETQKIAEQEAALDPTLPKLVVVAGANTHLSGGPTHHLLDPEESGPVTERTSAPSEPTKSRTQATSNGGIFDDVAQDFGLSVNDIKQSFSIFRSKV